MKKLIIFFVFLFLISNIAFAENREPSAEIEIRPKIETILDYEGNYHTDFVLTYINLGTKNGSFQLFYKIDSSSPHKNEKYLWNGEEIEYKESMGEEIWVGLDVYQHGNFQYSYDPTVKTCCDKEPCFKFNFNIDTLKNELLNKSNEYVSFFISNPELIVKIPKRRYYIFYELEFDSNPEPDSESLQGDYKLLIWDNYFIDKQYHKELPKIIVNYNYKPSDQIFWILIPFILGLVPSLLFYLIYLKRKRKIDKILSGQIKIKGISGKTLEKIKREIN